MKRNLTIAHLACILLMGSTARAQISLTNPVICHDKDRFLKCYNDGSYHLTFEKGNFKTLTTSDQHVKYSEVEKKYTFLHTINFRDSTVTDTIHLILLPHSVLMKKKNAQLEIHSLKNIPFEIHEYGISYYSVNNFVQGFTFQAGNKEVQIDIHTFGKTWSWDMIMQDGPTRLAILYNVYKKNRVRHIFL